MKKLLLILLLWGCAENREPQPTAPNLSRGTSFNIEAPDLIIVDSTWGSSGLAGLRGGNWLVRWEYVDSNSFIHRVYHIPTGLRRTFNYECPIANIAQVSGLDTSKYDFVVDRSESGMLDSIAGYGYNFPGLISLELFVGGIPIQGFKQNFWFENTHCFNYFCPEYRRYDYDTMWISVNSADMYRNTIDITDIYGYAVLMVKVNPDGIFTEQNYDNNEAILPMFIDSGGVYVNWAALNFQKPTAPTDVLCGRSKNGKIASIIWSETAEHYTISRNGSQLAEIDSTHFIDSTLSPREKTVIYGIVAHNDFGFSDTTFCVIGRK